MKKVKREESMLPPCHNMVKQVASEQFRNSAISDMASVEVKLEMESRYFLSVFPEEIWLIIAELNQNSKDLQNLCNSSPFFGNLLDRQRVVFLFPPVWKLIGEKFRKECEVDFDQGRLPRKKATICDTCGKRRESAAFSSILDLRLVCKTWRDAVNSLCQDLNKSMHFELEHDEKVVGAVDYSKYHWTWEIFGLRDGNMEQARFNQFESHFRSSHGAVGDRCPFFGGSLHILSTVINAPALQMKMRNFLSKYGSHVLYCVIQSEVTHEVDTTFLLLLAELLRLMPNLKSFEMEFVHGMQLEFFPRELVQAELPTLQNLQYFSAKGIRAPLINAFLRNNNHIKILEVVGMKPFHGETLDVSIRMPNLNEFSIGGHFAADMQLLQSSDLTWNLQKFHSDFKSSHVFLEWSTIFNLLETKWAQDLKDLVVHLPGGDYPEERNAITVRVVRLRLNLPVLQRFKVFVCNYTSLDFILPMRESLESLEVCIPINEHGWRRDEEVQFVEEEQFIQFIGYTNRLYESNIWTLFPKIKKITVEQEYNPENGDRFRIGRQWKAHSWEYSRKEWEARQ